MELKKLDESLLILIETAKKLKVINDVNNIKSTMLYGRLTSNYPADHMKFLQCAKSIIEILQNLFPHNNI